MTDQEFQALLPVLQHLVWATRDERNRLQQHGISIIPANFYSNIPTLAEVSRSFEYLEVEPPYLNLKLFNENALRDELVDLIEFGKNFDFAAAGDEKTCRSYYSNNGQFPCADAIAYFAYIRRIKPNKIVEIGSGFSSLVAIEALKMNGKGSITCIEPFPRPFITALAAEGALRLHAVEAQAVSAQMLNSLLDDGDILFIDSTHTVKTGSDCMHIYLRLLPNIKKRIIVHVHDIALPFGFPQSWIVDRHIYWTEQYLLLALMIDNPKVKVLFGGAYHSHFNQALLSELSRGRCIDCGGGSFWLEYDGTL
jgi:hypothetical protein